MTVEQLMTPFKLAQSDMQQITKDRNDMNNKMNALSLVFLPALKTIIDGLREEMRYTDGKTLAILTETPQVLGALALTDLVAGLESLQQGDSTAETSAAIDQLSTEIRKEINNSLLRVVADTKTLDDALSSLRAVNLVIDPEEMTERETSIASDEAVIESQQTSQGSIQDKLRLLKVTIGVLEDATIADYLKPAVTILVALADLDPKNPLIGTVKAGLKGLEDMLGVVSDVMKYEDLIRARTQLQKDEEEQLERIDRTRKRCEQTRKQLLDLQRFIALAAPRDSYVREVNNIRLSLEQFLQLTEGPADVDAAVLASRFSNNRTALINHLNDLRRDWNIL